MPARKRSREAARPAPPLDLPDLAAAIATHLPGEWVARPAGNPKWHTLTHAPDGAPTLLLRAPAPGRVAVEALAPTAPPGVPIAARTGRTVGEIEMDANAPAAVAAAIAAELLPAYRAAANNLDRDVMDWRRRKAMVTRTANALAAVPGVERAAGSSDEAPVLTAAATSNGPEPVDVRISVAAPHGAASVRIVAEHLSEQQARRVLDALRDTA